MTDRNEYEYGDLVEYIGQECDILFTSTHASIGDRIHRIRPMDIFVFVEKIDESKIRVKSQYGYLENNAEGIGIIRPLIILVLNRQNANKR